VQQMNMNQYKNRSLVLVRYALIVFAAVWFSSCQTMPKFSEIGRVVPPEKRISLTHGGTQEGQWTTPDLTLAYRYEETGNRFTISGTVYFADALQTGFGTLDRFFLKVVLVNGTGTTLVSQSLLTAGYRSPMGRLIFKRSISLPTDTAAMAFGYSGKASDGVSGDDGINWHFGKTPF